MGVALAPELQQPPPAVASESTYYYKYPPLISCHRRRLINFTYYNYSLEYPEQVAWMPLIAVPLVT